MVTQLFGSTVYDVLQLAASDAFFDSTASARKKLVQAGLEKDYPTSIRSYLESVSGEAFVADAEGALQVLGGSVSVIEEARPLARKNTLFAAFLDALPMIRSYTSTQTALGQSLDSFRQAGGSYGRILDRELQTLLLHARGEDSPIIQVAADVALPDAKLSGVPSVTVRKELIGGVRVFQNGVLTDDSWRARLTRVLTAVS